MTNEEFRNLQHGDKIKGPNGINYIVHNNHQSGIGLVVAVRSIVIPSRQASFWSITKKHELTISIADGIYQVRILGKIDKT